MDRLRIFHTHLLRGRVPQQINICSPYQSELNGKWTYAHRTTIHTALKLLMTFSIKVTRGQKFISLNDIKCSHYLYFKTLVVTSRVTEVLTFFFFFFKLWVAYLASTAQDCLKDRFKQLYRGSLNFQERAQRQLHLTLCRTWNHWLLLVGCNT